MLSHFDKPCFRVLINCVFAFDKLMINDLIKRFASEHQVAIQPISFNGIFRRCVNDETSFNFNESPRFDDKNKHTFDLDSWFVTYCILTFSSPSYSRSQPLSNHFWKKWQGRGKLTAWWCLEFQKLFWNSKFQTCLVWLELHTNYLALVL